jgi:hypothetical protein
MDKPTPSHQPNCIRCSEKMRLSCTEIEKPGSVHHVYECTKCRSIQSYMTPEQPLGFRVTRRDTEDTRSGTDTRPEAEKQLIGERRSRIARRSNHDRKVIEQPSNDQLSLFVKRVKRAMRDDKSRHFFGVASGESDFSGYADVLRSLEWFEDLVRD